MLFALLALWSWAIIAGGPVVAQEQVPPVESAAPVDPGSDQDYSTTVEVQDARVTTTPQRARLVIDLSKKAEYALVSLANPDRIAIDVKADSLGIAAPADVAGQGIVSSFGIELAEPGRVRTTLTLSTPAQVQQAYVLEPVPGQPARLVVDLITDTPEHFAETAAKDLAASPALRGSIDPTQQAAIDAAMKLASANPADVPAPGHPNAPTVVTTPDQPTVETPAPPPVQTAPGQAAGDGTRPLIVLDPGHGGIDNGATAPNGVHEKDITLAFALDLQKALIATGRFDVALTREDDTYLTLNQRVDLARQNKADLFISLHADTFPQHDIKGTSIYTRDENATDVLDKVLADNENRYDVVAGFAVPSQTAPAAMDILLDLMRREMRKSAYVAAEDIVQALQPKVTLRPFAVRQADFFVLQAPDVPSLLIELGFLSNPEDVTNLQKPDWRAKVVEALTTGVEQYFDDNRRLAATD